MLKTIKKDEYILVKQILRKYFYYVTRENRNTLISRIFGLHKVKFFKKKNQLDKKIYLCIMNNVFKTSKRIDYRYDLKGSLQGRLTIRNISKPPDPSIALKEQDF